MIKITDIEIILKSKFGIVFNEEFIFNEVYLEEYNYLINKYDLNEYEQNILYYIINIQYPEKETNINTNTFQLVVSMYNEKKISRIIK